MEPSHSSTFQRTVSCRQREPAPAARPRLLDPQATITPCLPAALICGNSPPTSVDVRRCPSPLSLTLSLTARRCRQTSNLSRSAGGPSALSRSAGGSAIGPHRNWRPRSCGGDLIMRWHCRDVTVEPDVDDGCDVPRSALNNSFTQVTVFSAGRRGVGHACREDLIYAGNYPNGSGAVGRRGDRGRPGPGGECVRVPG